MGSRDSNPTYPSEDGVWFQILDQNGNRMQLSPKTARHLDFDYDTKLGWFSITYLALPSGSPPYNRPVGFILDMIITPAQTRHWIPMILSVLILKTPACHSQNDPFTIKEKNGLQNILKGARVPFDDNSWVDPTADGTNNSSSDDQDNNTTDDRGASQVTNSDPYQYFTRHVQNTSGADWSRYTDLNAIQNSYAGKFCGPMGASLQEFVRMRVTPA
ncbi:hypothetical protein CPB84DRAFT_1753927 [Gymnopilus junonius]|uniref:Uncharacterized protein n=1 Tax=Gymnopilus junonius TaxID=109634 RepID=A0A9P5TEV7_GYMJU|nr:hypothetical protein CPB84DRAFT_1753927 [Gymnopilus junonius]